MEVRSRELLEEFEGFQNKVYERKPNLAKNRIFQFSIKLNRKGQWIFQCLNQPLVFEIKNCKTSTTMLKRLSYLSNREKLDFARDIENSREFHIAIEHRKAKQLKMTF